MLSFYLSTLNNESDKRTFAQIYSQYDSRLRHVVNRYLKNNADAQDAMQNTWLGVLKKMDLCSEMAEGELQAYIMTIAKNQAISIARKNQKEKEIFIEADTEDLADEEDFFEFCDKQDVSDIVACINMLSDAQKEVITLHYLYHHSLKEIAKMFGISVSVAESRWKNGRARLMQLLQRKEIYATEEKNKK